MIGVEVDPMDQRWRAYGNEYECGYKYPYDEIEPVYVHAFHIGIFFNNPSFVNAKKILKPINKAKKI